MRNIALTLTAGLALAACSAGGGTNPVTPAAAPAVVGPTTTTAIRAADLRMHLEVFAHDSMLGREAGTLGNVKATDYLAAQLTALGLDPAGDDGSFLQTIPMVRRAPDTTGVLVAGADSFPFRRDWIAVPSFGGFLPFGTSGSLRDAPVVFGGRIGDTTMLDPAAAEGRVVVFLPPQAGGNPNFQFWQAEGALDPYGAALGIAVVSLDISPPQIADIFSQVQDDLASGSVHGGGDGPLGMVVSAAAAEAMLGVAADAAEVGATGTAVSGGPTFSEEPVGHPARNVVAMVPGTDPALRDQYVAIGAHSDHTGIASQAADHDSLRAFNRVVRPGGAESPNRPASADEQAAVRTLIDSLRLQRPPRADSIRNGADDDGSGSVTLLELAQYFVRNPTSRSLVFVWHTAEEKGLFGAQYFTEHPSVPRESIVAQLNMDMIGRGGLTDTEGGGTGYLQLIGSRRLSTELGDVVEAVNTEGRFGFRFDYQFDADGHPQNFYCRSDHYMYARFGIPVVFFSTGGHVDYHQVTDEPEYINYDKMARVARLVAAVAERVANLDHRVVVDRPLPDPYGSCQQ